MRIIAKATVTAVTVLCLTMLTAAQNQPLAFEVASVKQNNDRSVQPALRYTPSGIDFARVPITWIIGEAYEVPYYSQTAISTNDNAVRELLLPRDRYDISARAERAASREEVRLMLQALLANRFKLRLHRDSKVQPIYKLSIGNNGIKLRKSADQSDTVEPLIGNDAGGYDFRHVDMTRVVGFLSGLLDRPVVDSTGLKGFYDFALKLEADPPQDKTTTRASISSSIQAGIERQIGLTLQPDRASVDQLVIDHVEKPSEN